MPATKTRETIYEKAERILSDPTRVRTSVMSNAPAYWTGEVDGDHGTYQVAAIGEAFAKRHGMPGASVACSCPAGIGLYRRNRQPQRCAHMIVAEEMRIREENS